MANRVIKESVIAAKIKERIIGDQEPCGGFVVELETSATGSSKVRLAVVPFRKLRGIPKGYDFSEENVKKFELNTLKVDYLTDFYSQLKVIIGSKPWKIRKDAAALLIEIIDEDADTYEDEEY